MKLPNILTISRFFVAFAMMLLLSLSFPFAKSTALFLFVVAGFTDFLDGYLARNVYGVSSFGKLMDPLADKVIVCAALVSFVEIQLPTYPGPLVPAYLVVIIISREFLVTGLRLLAAGKGKVISAGKWGKHKTVWQIVAIVFILLGLAIRHDMLIGASEQTLVDFDFALHWIALTLTVAVSLITVVSGAKYFYEHRELIYRNV